MPQIFGELRERYGTPESFVFQQDGARPHTAKTTQQFLAGRAVLPPQEIHWPANSPDLNVIENLWAIIKHEFKYEAIKDANSLFQEATRVWDSVDLEVINKLVRDFDPRLRTCVAVQGQCLNRYKPVLRGFRASETAGQTDVKRFMIEQQRTEEFLRESHQFFTVKKEQFALSIELGDATTATSLCDKEKRNRLLWEESCEIIKILPLSVQRKCALPWLLKCHTRVPVLSGEADG